jgi:hypothetical protein
MATTPRARSAAQLRELVAGTAFLERCGELQVLELQEHLGLHDLRQRARLDAGREQHLALQPLGRPLNGLQINHGQIVGGNTRAGGAAFAHQGIPSTRTLRYGEVSKQSGWRLIHGQAFGF